MNYKWIVLYDGSCGFCNFWVKWILDRDTQGVFKFASLQGKFGQKFLLKHNLSITDFDTLYIVNEKGQFKTKLNAVIEINKTLGGFYSLAIVLYLLPLAIRDKIYDQIAQRRKKIMGENCYIPSPEERARFLD